MQHCRDFMLVVSSIAVVCMATCTVHTPQTGILISAMKYKKHLKKGRINNKLYNWQLLGVTCRIQTS